MSILNQTKKVALNRNIILFFLGGLFLALLAYFSIDEGEIGLGIAFAVFAL